MMNDPTRRGIIAGAGLTALAPALAWGQEAKPQLGSPPTVISSPPRQWGRSAPPDIYPDPDILVIDKSFAPLRVGLAAIPTEIDHARRLPEGDRKRGSTRRAIGCIRERWQARTYRGWRLTASASRFGARRMRAS